MANHSSIITWEIPWNFYMEISTWWSTVHGKEWDGGTEQQQHHLLYLASFCTNEFYFLPYNSAFKKINNLKINTMVSF